MKRHSLLRRIAPLLLTAALVLPLTGQVSVTPVSAVTQAEIDALKSSAGELASQKKDLQNQLKTIQAEKADALDQKDVLERQIGVIRSEIKNTAEQISKYQELITQKETELNETLQKEAEQYDLFCRRIRTMEEEGEISYWSILFSSSDFTDLLDRFMMVEEIIQYDNSVMDNLLAIQAQVEEEKASLEETKAGLETAKAEQESARKELESQEAAVDKLIGEINEKEDELEKAEAELRKAADAMNAEIKRKEKELAEQIAKVVSESGFQWPLSGSYNTLSSLYGNRTHPLTGKPNNHTGIDIPAPRNTQIYASKSGVVITSERGRSYGEYVVISHSDGTSTLYAHMNRRGVSEGQTVKQGQVIGYVGTTGSSTGNHLHFEVRVNGNRRDPVDYFKDKTLYVTYKGQKQQLPH